MNTWAIYNDGKLICSNSDAILAGRGPEPSEKIGAHVIEYRETAGGRLVELACASVVDIIEQMADMAAELAAYKEDLQKLKKNLTQHADGKGTCSCEAPNYVKTTATKSGCICLNCGGE